MTTLCVCRSNETPNSGEGPLYWDATRYHISLGFVRVPSGPRSTSIGYPCHCHEQLVVDLRRPQAAFPGDFFGEFLSCR